MYITDVLVLVVSWFILVTVLYLVKKTRQLKTELQILYGVALLVRGRENVEDILSKFCRLILKIPDKPLIVFICTLFLITMLFIIPVPILLFPVPAISGLFVMKMFLNSPIITILRNLILVIEAFTKKLTPSAMISMGFLSLQPIIPGLTVRLTTFLLILIAAGISITIHELAHGIIAKRYGVKVKSGGFFTSFFILMGGFVEPEEEDLRRLSLEKRLAIYSAGVVANILLAYVVLIIYLILKLCTIHFGSPLGVVVTSSNVSKIPTYSKLIKVNGTYVMNTYDLMYVLSNLIYEKCVPDSTLLFTFIVQGHHTLIPVKLGKCYLSEVVYKVGLSQIILRKPSIALSNTLLYRFLFWLFNLNITLALLNTLPAYPLDGGQFVEAVLEEVLEGKSRLVKFIVCVISAIFYLGLVLTIVYTFKSGLYITG